MREIIEALGLLIAGGAVFVAYLRGRKEGYDEAVRTLPSHEEMDRYKEEVAERRKGVIEKWKKDQADKVK